MAVFNMVASSSGGGSGTWKTASCNVALSQISFNTTAKAKCFVVHWTSGDVSSSSMVNGVTVGAIYTGGSSATLFNIKYGRLYTASTGTDNPVITDSTVMIGTITSYRYAGIYTAYYLV